MRPTRASAAAGPLASPPSADQEIASGAAPLDPTGAACGLPSQLPSVVVLRRPVEFTQYTSLAFGQRLAQAGILPSMSRVANCWDNAVAESFFATLKGDLVDRQPWPTRAAARSAIFDYLEGFYNRRRRHSTLGYVSPVAYEAAHRSSRATATA